jgi:NADH:ubiquinone oxidoreductase subunit 6 (subunit J)
MKSWIPRALAVALMALLFILAVSAVSWPQGEVDGSLNSHVVGEKLFGSYGVVMLLVGLLLLVALLGGVFLAKEEEKE